jgi:hypothetical protein
VIYVVAVPLDDVWHPTRLTVIRKDLWIPDEAKQWNPKGNLGRYVKSILHLLPYEQAMELFRRISQSLVIESSLSVRIFRPDGSLWDDLGVVSEKVVTDAGVAYLVDAFQNLTEIENFKYHGIGTGTTAESVSQSALVTELTTQYNPDNTRATGSQTEGATANVYKSVGSVTVDAVVTIGEHGIFSSATSGAGTMFDRSLVSPTIPLTSGSVMENTYQLTCNSGG